jgi:hypothetical protein
MHPTFCALTVYGQHDHSRAGHEGTPSTLRVATVTLWPTDAGGPQRYSRHGSASASSMLSPIATGVSGQSFSAPAGGAPGRGVVRRRYAALLQLLRRQLVEEAKIRVPRVCSARRVSWLVSRCAASASPPPIRPGRAAQ